MINQSKIESKETYLALGCIILAVLFWGFSFISTKIVLQQIPPISIAFFRQVITAAILVPWLIWIKSLPRASWKTLIVIAAASLFGIVFYFILENYGIKFTTASNASMIVSALPIFTLLSEAIFFKLKVTWRMILCIGLSMLGVYFVVTVDGRLDVSSARFVGNLLVLGAMVCWVIYTILNKQLSKDYSSMAITAYQSLVSVALFAPLILTEVSQWDTIKAWSGIVWLNLVFLGIFCSGLAYFCYIYAVKRLGATIAAAFLNLVPVVTVIGGFFILHEKLTFMQLGGIVLIMIALFKLSQLTSRPEQARVTKESGRQKPDSEIPV